MSEMGQSLPSQFAPKFSNVRFAPIATVSCQNAIRRYVPSRDVTDAALPQSAGTISFQKWPNSRLQSVRPGIYQPGLRRGPI